VGRGGVRTHRPTAQGLLTDQPAHLIDIMATCLDVARAAYPQEFGGQPIKPFAGVTLRPALEGKALRREQPIFWEHEGNRAVRDGKWKLVAKANKPWELYDMAADRTETYDLAGARPDEVRELAAAWDAWAKGANVLPLGGWRDDSDLSKEARFVLKSGSRLSRKDAPAIAAQGFTITANFDASGRDGVIVAQGGSAHGYTLFLNEGKVTFAVRRAGALTSIAAEKPLAGRHVVIARLDSAGAMTLTFDGMKVASGKAAGPLAAMPRDGLEVGSDEGGVVGPYTTRNAFPGTIESVVIELNDVPQ
jgi:hypothetical protein